jgi:CPA1 family monovalent cation:H+ antiporter
VGDIEFLLLLLAAAAVCVRLAELIHVPYPIVLVLGGLAIGLTPQLPVLELDPDVVFLVFLPPLLFSAAWYSSPQELRVEARPLTLLAIGLVLATMAAVAVVAHAIVPGMSWEAAFVLGAIVGPTDPVSATATFARLGAPVRVRVLVEGEALINDGTALVAYRVALAAAVEGTFSAPDAVLEFVVNGVGGVAIGLVIGMGSILVIRRQSDVALSIFISVVTAYACYVVAEEAHVSGVLATVAGGMVNGWNAHKAFDANTRLSGIAFWGVMTFGLEALLFILLGLQAPVLADDLEIGALVLQALAVALCVIAVRMAWMLIPFSGFGETARERLLVGWAGMRGAISLAAALAVPTSVAERPEILLLTFGVIGVTLLGQGLTLGPLLRRLRLPGPNRWSPDEAQVRLETAQAALDRIDEGAAAEPLRRLRDLYRTRFAICVAVMGGGELPEDGREELRNYGAMRRELIAVERATLLRLRGERMVGLDTIRRVERDLDLEEARIQR